MTIAEAYRRVSRLNLRSQVQVIIELTKEEVILLNQAQLYTQSIDSNGSPLGGYSLRWYEELKASMNPGLGGLVDLNLTGDFYGGFYVAVGDVEFEIGSTDQKSDKLEKRYGAIFGLTDENKAMYAKGVFFTALKNYIEGITGFQLI